MTALTATQIRSGFKGKQTLILAPKRVQVARWRCALCPWPRWVEGDYASWLDHYQTLHQDKDNP